MNCKNFKIRTKKGIKYFYCSLKKEKLNCDSCKGCEFLEYKPIKGFRKCKPIVYKRNPKIVTLEKNRTSVLTNNLNKCYFCDKPKVHIHEIFEGKNRLKSMKYGFCVPVCLEHHSILHENGHLSRKTKEIAQLYYESNIGSKRAFIELFGQNYIR